MYKKIKDKGYSMYAMNDVHIGNFVLELVAMPTMIQTVKTANISPVKSHVKSRKYMTAKRTENPRTLSMNTPLCNCTS